MGHILLVAVHSYPHVGLELLELAVTLPGLQGRKDEKDDTQTTIRP